MILLHRYPAVDSTVCFDRLLAYAGLNESSRLTVLCESSIDKPSYINIRPYLPKPSMKLLKYSTQLSKDSFRLLFWAGSWWPIAKPEKR